MRRVFKTRFFGRWSRKSGVTDPLLCIAVEEMERGLIDADLGGNLYKKRIAVGGQGKRGGARVIVATRHGAHWFFLDGYLKSVQDDLSPREVRELREIASALLEYDAQALELLLETTQLEEVICVR